MLVTTQCHASRWSMQFLWLHTLTLLSHSNHELAGESLLCMSGLACCCAWHLPEVNIGIVHCAVCITLCLPCHVAVRLSLHATNTFNLSHFCSWSFSCWHYSWALFTYSEWWSKQASKQENIHTHVQCRHKKYASIMSSTYFLSTFFSCIHRTKPK